MRCRKYEAEKERKDGDTYSQHCVVFPVFGSIQFFSSQHFKSQTLVKLQESNILFSKFSQTAVARLRFVKNAAARLTTRTDRRSHVTLNLASLHRLPVNFRIDFKILLITLKALHGLAPACISVLPKPDTAEHHPDFETTSFLIS